MGDRPAKLNEKKSDIELEWEIKNKGNIFLLENGNFVAALWKWEMLAATNVKMRGSEKKVSKNTYDISSIKRVTRKFSGSFTL